MNQESKRILEISVVSCACLYRIKSLCETFILNEIQSDRHCEQMASCEGEKIGNVDLK